MVSCPYCGNESDITTSTSCKAYCTTCGHIFDMRSLTKTNFSTAAIEKYITDRLPNAANDRRGFYRVEDGINLWQPEENKLTINAEDIIINNDKISITIDKDNIDKFDVIEINGVRFMKEADHA